jgi:hypothetical protein
VTLRDFKCSYVPMPDGIVFCLKEQDEDASQDSELRCMESNYKRLQ